MTQFFSIHPANPQPRLIRQAAELVRSGKVIAYPTDSCYALGCRLDDREAIERIRAIRALDAKHHLTLVCRDLSEVARYARVDNRQFRLLKSATPGSYTFILEATREVPKRLQHPRRNTIGLRVPDHPVAQALLGELDEAILSTSLVLPGDELPLNDAEEIRERLEGQVDLIIDSGACGFETTTVVDLTGAGPQVLRAGKGQLGVFGLA
ncbi:MAG: threonylcarbamoyl-AMP synthase [Burkholderiales bacterium]|nr:threonylcarbamoyl-AMP synthase [Burkholderiales bacterium]